MPSFSFSARAQRVRTPMTARYNVALSVAALAADATELRKRAISEIISEMARYGHSVKTEFLLNHSYRSILKALNDHQKFVKKLFFGKIGYIITDWQVVNFSQIEKDVYAMWVKLTDVNYVRPSDIVECKTMAE